LLESGVVLVYCRWRGRGSTSLLLSSLPANLVTQAFLWTALSYFWRSDLVVLFLSELVIWAAESLMLWVVPSNRLTLREATRLSFLMNATSFGLGWLLPV
jgi:Na+/melibiose symporter-like transporter